MQMSSPTLWHQFAVEDASEDDEDPVPSTYPYLVWREHLLCSIPSERCQMQYADPRADRAWDDNGRRAHA